MRKLTASAIGRVFDTESRLYSIKDGESKSPGQSFDDEGTYHELSLAMVNFTLHLQGAEKKKTLNLK